MRYTPRYHPDVLHVDFPKLDRKILRRIETAILSKISTDPTRYGAPLRHTLKGYWKLRVGNYRVIFRLVETEVRILAVIHRSRVYEIAPKRL